MDVNSSHGRRAVSKSISGSVITGGLAPVNTVNAEESNPGFSADIMVDSYSSATENYTIEVVDRITRDVLFSTSVEVSPGSHKEYEKVFPEGEMDYAPVLTAGECIEIVASALIPPDWPSEHTRARRG